MKKILLGLISLLLVCISVFASDYTIFPYDTNLILQNDTYRNLGNGYYGCFGYINKSQAKLKGKVFMSELSCVKFDKTTGDIYISDKSTFNYTDDKLNTYKTKSNPYYFENKKIQCDIIDFFLAIENGGFSDRD